MRVLSFDPGFGRTGWGCIESKANITRLLPGGWGVIETYADMEHSQRLDAIYTASLALIKNHNPDVVVIEKLFLSKNKTTVAGVYQAQGVLFAVCGHLSISPLELGPTQIKKAVTGSGRAQKSEVLAMVQRILGVSEKITPDDAADALAGAIAGVQYASFRTAIQGRVIQR